MHRFYSQHGPIYVPPTFRLQLLAIELLASEGTFTGYEEEF